MGRIKAYTDLSQSKILSKILPLESADMYWSFGNIKFMDNDYDFNIIQHIPCWSLAALLGVLPEIQGGKPAISLNDNYITYPRISDLHTEASNLVDACYELILKLHELNLL